jgi:glyoxylase-like metal-dependent hydrolase (beta-lactamase superfamily II)
VSVHIRSKGEEAIITGDMMHHPIQLAVPETQANFDMDKAQGAKTRVEFVRRYADRKVLIIGSHFCEPTSGWIVRDGAAWKLALK